MMRDRPARAGLSEAARRYRVLMWVLAAAALVPFSLFVAGLRDILPRDLGLAALPLGFACLITAAWMGWRGHRQALLDRERSGHQAMIIAIAAQLGRQEDAALERIAGAGGPAGEAATWILAGRAERRAAGRQGSPSRGA